MSKLIAQVPTAVDVDGERVIIQPGQELPDINEHDATELTKAGAAVDKQDEKDQQAEEKKAKAKAQAEIDAARQKVEAAQASTQTTPTAAKKPAAKKE